MTHLKGKVTRITGGKVYEQGAEREIIVTLSSPNVISLRAKGLRGCYTLTIEAIYSLAVKANVLRSER